MTSFHSSGILFNPYIFTGVNKTRIEFIAIPHINKQDKGLTITRIAICLAASRCLNTFKAKETDYQGCQAILRIWGLSGPLCRPVICFTERILLYLAAHLSILSGYNAKTITKKVRAYLSVDQGFLCSPAKFSTLSDFIKGYKYLYQPPHRGALFFLSKV